MLHIWVSILLALNHYADVEGCMEDGGPDMVAICGVVWWAEDAGDGAELPCICICTICCAFCAVIAELGGGLANGRKVGSFVGSMPGNNVCSFWYCSLMNFSLSSRPSLPSTFSVSEPGAGIGRNLSFRLKEGAER